MRDDQLSDEEQWQADGHLTETSLTALADGERALLSPSAEGHAGACDACTERLGKLVLMSLSVGEALGEHTPASELGAARAAQPVPAWAVALGLGLALIGALPALAGLPAWLASAPRGFIDTVSFMARLIGSMTKVASTAGPALLVVWAVATVTLTILGLLVARLAPRRSEWKGARA
jgi:hypothetical protein